MPSRLANVNDLLLAEIPASSAGVQALHASPQSIKLVALDSSIALPFMNKHKIKMSVSEELIFYSSNTRECYTFFDLREQI